MTAIMKSEPTPSDHEVLTGLVERVTYQNAREWLLRPAGQGPWPMADAAAHTPIAPVRSFLG